MMVIGRRTDEVGMDQEGEPDFDEFAGRVWLPVRQALVGALGADRGVEAHALAMVYAWEHRDRVMAMDSPVGYLFTVGRSQSRNRRKRLPVLYPPPPPGTPDYEPRLPGAMAALPEKQRVAVFLVVGCGWT